MPLTLTANPALASSFRTALLLTGDIGLAEDAVLEAIQALDPEKIPDQALLRGTILAAVAFGNELPAGKQQRGNLAPELMRVLRLPTPLRHCFVLRILVALPEADCARILNLSIPTVEERTCQAVWRLAGNPTGSRCLGLPHNPFALVAENLKVLGQDYAAS